MTNDQKQTYTRRISAANRAQLVTVVYDMTLDYMADGKEAIAEESWDDADFALTHARSCLDDLIGALDMQYEMSRGLMELYLFCKRELSAAQGKRDAARIANAKTVIDKLRGAWKQIEDQDTSDASFDNAQTVYAGLTYSRNSLMENTKEYVDEAGRARMERDAALKEMEVMRSKIEQLENSLKLKRLAESINQNGKS